jgi:UDP-glucose 4-epimerase
MKILVTGSAGHLGEGLMRTLSGDHDVIGVDIKPSPFSHFVGSIPEREFVRTCMDGVDAVLHTATLHKPHVATHAYQDFVDTNITGTLNLLEEAKRASVGIFVFTSTTSVYGGAFIHGENDSALWITEDVTPQPKNIYGVTKLAAEGLCELFHHRHGMNCLVLRTSRFFPEPDDDESKREAYSDANAKVNDLLCRRADIEDIVSAHLCAIERGPKLGFGRYIVCATSPFTSDDLLELHQNAPAVVARHVPEFQSIYASLGWSIFPRIDRVYRNDRAQVELGWRPRHDFMTALDRLRDGQDYRSELARSIGAKGYHNVTFDGVPYPV